jgi:4-hydroxy-tetrahydrodipicolinate synthase
MLSQTLAAAGSDCRGVFGGQAGQYVLDEYRRGAVGNMPACPTTDVLQMVWARLEAGDEPGARGVFNRILPLINYERLHGIALYKELLYRRGVIASRTMRNPGQELDDQDRVELEAILADIEPLYQV